MSRSDPQPPLEGTKVITLSTRDAQGQAVEYVEEIAAPAVSASDEEWLQLSQQAYENSTHWLQSDMYGQWERNIANFRSLHPPGSKYHTNAYKFRSKMFRPKTRTAIRKLEAGIAAALFNNKDLVHIEPQNQSDPQSVASASINFELIQERLSTTVPWYQLCVGATQDAANYGAVVSYQYWEYIEDEFGQPVKDTPVIELVPPENLRIDRAANWLDPINSSPYLIQLIPMFITDVLDRMERVDRKTLQPEWRGYTKEELQSANKEDHDALRSQRNAPQTDPHSDQHNTPISEFDTVWVHRNIMRKGGKDWMFYTVGTELLLTDPVPVREVCPWLKYGERPYTMGTAALESHKVFPDSLVQLGQNLQSIANDVANRRHDNVLLAMDKRFIIRREANIDRDSLFRTVPGGGIETDDPNTDVKVIETGDVTGSAYAEQDRVNADFDDLMGTFNSGSVQTNRRLGETVGGMNLLASESTGMTDYVIRTMLMTWVRPLMYQLVKLEQYYESDAMLLAVAANKAQVYQKFGVSQITDEMLRQTLTVNVNVGIGATDPARRMEVLMTGVNTLIQLPGLAQRMNVDEIVKEVFAAVGYQDGARFVRPDEGPTPMEQELMARVQELEGILQSKQVETQARIDMERVRQQGQIEEARIRGEYELATEALKQRVDDLNVLIKAEQNAIKRGELELEKEALQYQMLANKLNLQLQDRKESREAIRDYLQQGDTGKRTETPGQPSGVQRPNPRVADSGAGVLMRDEYGNVPFAEG